MKIIATSDWHLGNLFHGNDRLPEHKHFLQWLLTQIETHQPDALLIAGDVFDNTNPSAMAQSAYYEFLADAGKRCPAMQIVITAGNHDSASRLEAPRPLLSRHKVEVRGNIKRIWQLDDNGEGRWTYDYADLIIPLNDDVAIIAVPYLRNDVMQGTSYSDGVNRFLSELTAKARELYPTRRLVMMAHMYAKGAEIASKDASEKIMIGGQEEVSMEGWDGHPDYLTCGHIHKRQHIWNTNWARYTGSVLPMSFAEKDYTHGVDLIALNDKGKVEVSQLVYTPQHKLCVLPENDDELSLAKLSKLIKHQLPDRNNGQLDANFLYVTLRVKCDMVSGEIIKTLEDLVNSKNAVLCKIQKIIPEISFTTIAEDMHISSVEDILERDPMEALNEAFLIKHSHEMSDRMKGLLREVVSGIKNEDENE